MRFAKYIAFVASLGVAACNAVDSLLEVTDPDIINPDDIQTASAAEALRIGVLSRLNLATSGNESFLLLGGLLADEYRSGDTFVQRNETDRRNVQPNNINVRDAFRFAYRVRTSAMQAIEALTRFDAASWKIAEMYLAIAYAENQLAENACSGIPLSTVSGTEIVYDAPRRTAEVLQSALGHVNTALTTVSGTTADAERIRRAASVLKGRILLNIGKSRFAEAAATVAAVPTDYSYTQEHSQTSLVNAIWTLNNSLGRWIVSNGEGGNTINFATAGDPRVPVCRSSGSVTTGAGNLPTCPTGTISRAFDPGARIIPLFVQQIWPGRDSPVGIITGVEARLIEAEATLHAGDATTFLSIHNDLRARVPGLASLADPGTPRGREDLHFREKAFWLFGRGYRLGDMRRLVRQYLRPVEEIFPTGSWFKGGTFGSQVSFPIPQAEENNPEFPKNQACLDTGA
jgi:hypothetical protein